MLPQTSSKTHEKLLAISLKMLAGEAVGGFFEDTGNAIGGFFAGIFG